MPELVSAPCCGDLGAPVPCCGALGAPVPCCGALGAPCILVVVL
nr:hypothetical protein [Mycoplasmopsis bovis]